MGDTQPDDADEVIDARDTSSQDSEEDVDPFACDTGVVDCDSDGLTDCEEQQLGTDVCEPDSDGDGLSDFQELENRTNPLDHDTDGDGLVDGEEVELQLDPRDPTTFDDGIVDSDRWFIDMCDDARGEPLDFYESDWANWMLALPPVFRGNHTSLDIAGATRSNFYAADVYRDPAYGVSAATLSSEPGTGVSSPRDELNHIRDSIASLASKSGITVTGAAFPADHDDPTATAQFMVEVGTPMATDALRNDLLFSIAPFSAQDVTGLPAVGTNTFSKFRVSVSVVMREYNDGSTQVVTSFAVLDEAKYQARWRGRLDLLRVTDGSHIARRIRDDRVECHVLPPRSAPSVDVYWVIDSSSTMHDDIQQLRGAASELFDGLNSTRADVRVGVTTMEQSRGGRLLGPKWHTTPSEFQSALDSILNGPAPTGDDDGYVAATEGLSYMSYQDSTQPPADEAIPRSHQVFTVFFSDEEAETFQNTPLDANFSQLTAYASELRTHGDIHSITTRDATSYRFAALLHDGAYAPLGEAPLDEQLYELVEEFAGSSSRYFLPNRPIMSSLRVFVDENWVRPSRPDGYTYDPATNTVSFYGPARPFAGDADVEQGYTVIMYEHFAPHTLY